MINHSTKTLGFAQHLHNSGILFIIKRTSFYTPDKTVSIFNSFIRSSPIFINFATLIVTIKTCIAIMGCYITCIHLHINITVQIKSFLIGTAIIQPTT